MFYLNLSIAIILSQVRSKIRKETEKKYQEKLDFKINTKTIKKLRDLGLTDEQIAEALEISIEQIDNVIK